MAVNFKRNRFPPVEVRRLMSLGRRAVDYYVDTGLCVFCNADDARGVPHEDHCNVGVLARSAWTWWDPRDSK